MNGLNPRFNGMAVRLSESMTETGPPEKRRYTWWQRLTSWPWRPWVSHYWVTPQVPSPHVYRAGNSLVMHPATWARLKAQTDHLNEQHDRKWR